MEVSKSFCDFVKKNDCYILTQTFYRQEKYFCMKFGLSWNRLLVREQLELVTYGPDLTSPLEYS